MGEKSKAIDVLKACLRMVPDDDAALSLLVFRLVQPPAPGTPADESLVAQARSVASAHGETGERGNRGLALAVGFHRGGRPDLALPWAELAVASLDAPTAHLTLGDILLALAESEPDARRARPYFERAVEEYGRVLAAQPDSIEAVNNKAWILHRHLGQNSAALELVETFARERDVDALPAEFLDTLGAIQLAAGKLEEAEASFQSGLRKHPEHPFLNYHMGKSLLERTGDTERARPHLARALDGKADLPAATVDEIARLLGQPGS
jgi:tetratricopeptide (TPR) repeat protein